MFQNFEVEVGDILLEVHNNFVLAEDKIEMMDHLEV